jgi:pyruvate kinase
MEKKDVKVIVTLGPATNTKADLYKLKDKGVDFVRINMSHSTTDDLKRAIRLAKEVDIPFIIDTEGSQIRTGELPVDRISFQENDEVKIYTEDSIGDHKGIIIKPVHILEQLEAGDLIHVDFDALIFRVADVSAANQGCITAKALSDGTLGRNKAVAIDSALDKTFTLPTLSVKDHQSIAIGLEEGIEHVAASFMRSGQAVEEVREVSKGAMKIISKVECVDALKNLDDIIEKSDFLLIDRGDLSKEIPIEKIPLAQRIIMQKADSQNTGVFVATNLLETMIEKSRPTRAEAHDVITTILSGVSGLTLSAETAIGKYPMACVNMINRLIKQTEIVNNHKYFQKADAKLVKHLDDLNYFLEPSKFSTLIEPHGGVLVNRVNKDLIDAKHLDELAQIKIGPELQMDIEQISIGTFSPLEGFMGQEDFQSVLDNMTLKNGVVWTIPIILDITDQQAAQINIGDQVTLVDDKGVMAVLYVDDKYGFDKKEFAQKFYGTTDEKHPGVRWINSLNPVLLGGKIDLLRRRDSEFQEYDLTPKQVRRVFEERGWNKVVGFHTRNVIHRSHEFIQLKTLEDENCDGLFVHPVIGKKKAGDFRTKYIIESYNMMMKQFYPRSKVVFSTFSTFSRYAGPREAVFTALCRKNFGCSHFIVGRDHTGVGNFYHPKASHDIFDKLPDLGIKIVKFDKVFYSKELSQHIHEPEVPEHKDDDKLHISGTEARGIFEKGETPPDWFVRPEISKVIIEAVKKGESVFIKSRAKVIWFTGLSGSGKTTIAEQVKEKLASLGKKADIIDGDTIRSKQHKHLGFSREDIKENNKLIAELIKTKMDELDCILVPVISPYIEDRAMAKEIIGENFSEAFINAPLDKCVERDVKGLYKKALSGEIDNFIGVSKSNPYQAPVNPDIAIDTAKLDVDQSVEELLNFILK